MEIIRHAQNNTSTTFIRLFNRINTLTVKGKKTLRFEKIKALRKKNFSSWEDSTSKQYYY